MNFSLYILVKKSKKSKKSKKRKHEKEDEANEKAETLTEVHISAKSQKTTTTEPADDITSGKIDVDAAFNGSNLSKLYGYSPYNINCSLETLLNDKYKKANKKRVAVNKNLEIDAKFYENRKKKLCT